MDYSRTTYQRDPSTFTEFSPSENADPKFHNRTFMVSEAYGVDGLEQHHHKVKLTIAGEAPLKVYMGYFHRPDTVGMFSKYYNSFEWTLHPGTHEFEFEARYGSRDYNWWFYEVGGSVISQIEHTYYEGNTSWLAEKPIQQVEFFGGRARYYLSTPPNPVAGEKYPLIVSVGGSGELGDDGAILNQTDPACIIRKNYKRFTQFPAYYATYQVPFDRDFENWPAFQSEHPYHSGWHRYYGVDSPGMYGLRLLVAKLTTEYPDIDPERLYLTGFSGGGLLCFEALKAQRDLWAAIVPTAGWPIGQAYENVVNNQYWDNPYNGGLSLKERLLREMKQNKHTPLLIGNGSSDSMRYSCFEYEYLAEALDREVTHKIYPTSHTGVSKRVWSDFENLEWLMAQRLPAVIPPDPYPDFNYGERDIMNINLRALDHGKFAVIVNGEIKSEHVQEREASQEAINAKLADPTAEVSYKHNYSVMVDAQ